MAKLTPAELGRRSAAAKKAKLGEERYREGMRAIARLRRRRKKKTATQ